MRIPSNLACTVDGTTSATFGMNKTHRICICHIIHVKKMSIDGIVLRSHEFLIHTLYHTHSRIAYFHPTHIILLWTRSRRRHSGIMLSTDNRKYHAKYILNQTYMQLRNKHQCQYIDKNSTLAHKNTTNFSHHSSSPFRPSHLQEVPTFRIVHQFTQLITFQ